MKPEIDRTLTPEALQCVSGALELFTLATSEEEGGIVLHHPEKNEYEFVYLKNSIAGTPRARSLFVADPVEFCNKVVKRFRDGWQQYASLHTHPSFTPMASQVDVSYLFKGYPRNLIYAPLFGLVSAYETYADGETNLLGAVMYGFTSERSLVPLSTK